MTTGTIRFYKLPCSPVTGEYPIVKTYNTDPSTYKTTVYSNCKFTKDFKQRITIAEFATAFEVNAVQLSSGNWFGWYWITDRAQSSIVNGAIEFALEYNPITSSLYQGNTLPGWWTRAPVNISPWKQQAVISGAMKPTAIWNFNNTIVTLSSGTYQIFWVQVTATESLTAGRTSRLTTYGFPVACRVDSTAYWLSNVTIYSNAEGTFTATTCRFPTLETMLSDATCFGLSSADVIKDISISPILPFRCRIWVTDDAPVFALYARDTSATIAAVAFDTSTHRGAYETSGTFYERMPADNQGLNLTEMQVACGNITITDPSGSDIATIPPQWLEKSSSGTYPLVYTVECLTDYGQMTIRISIGDAMFHMPTMHLPYIGSAWDTYVAYSQAYDREALETGISYARDALNVQTNAAIANGLIGAVGKIASGDIGGAVSGLLGTGISTVTSYRLQDISDSQARFTQDLTERRIQAQPATGYSAAYGITYIKNALSRLPGITVYMPAGLTEEIFNTYIGRFGYSVEGYSELTLTEGYYQGRLTMASPRNTASIEQANEIFMQGVYLVFI